MLQKRKRGGSGMRSGENRATILIVEDDMEIQALLCDYLREHGFEVQSATDGRKASKMMKNNRYDLILMDLMLPYISGDHLIRELREYANTPVIVLSAKSMMDTRLTVLRIGADDYIIKPFDLSEVLVRIEVVLRRSGFSDSARTGGEGKGSTESLSTADGSLIYYAQENRVVYVEGQAAGDTETEITLTAKEMKLLHLFLQYPKKTFTKANLYEAVWQDTYYYEDNTINVHMSNLRSKLKKQTGRDYIDTVWGIGYRLSETESDKKG